MGEHLIIRQNRELHTEFMERIDESNGSDSAHFRAVENLGDLTPYGMVLASLGSCTAIVLNSYAEAHDIGLENVELFLKYERDFEKDCEDCEKERTFDEAISVRVSFSGDLSDDTRDKLFRISKHCSIHKILEGGIEIDSSLSDSSKQELLQHSNYDASGHAEGITT